MRVSLIFMLLIGITLVGCDRDQDKFKVKTRTVMDEIPEIEVVADTTETGLIIQNIENGEGAEAKAGDAVQVHYTGWLVNGKKFDSSVDRKKPFQFKLGAGEVIQGWDQGVQGMKVGGKRRLTIPSELAYGEKGAAGVIPPNSVLIFDVELLKIN